ncbi:MAG: serine/threonine protein kinase, partial [Myxococcales bacterium]|nr:serine/threonine protein kinase [Myxococcales bacterium]
MSEPEDDGPSATAQIKLASAGEKLPGTPYELGERLGGGGMGQVFRARHIELGRDVAVKLLAPALAHDPKAMERLRREARAAARLGNPHIIEIYDLGISDDGRPYVVMKLVDGRDLKKLLDAEAPLPPERVYGIIGQIGDALADAHAAGVVHRDLKPENVLVERRQGKDRVTLLDFGIAQSIQDTDSRLTREGQMIGTPGYMAPEQALARPLDGRADQYAVAVIAYEMLSGKSPFARITALQLLAAQLTQAPTPLGEVVDPAVVPPALQAVVMRGLERDPEARFVDMPAFVEAFGAALETPAALAPAPAGMGRGPMIAAAVLAVALIGLGTWFWRRAGQPTTPTVAGSANAAATNAVTPPVVAPVA